MLSESSSSDALRDLSLAAAAGDKAAEVEVMRQLDGAVVAVARRMAHCAEAGWSKEDLEQLARAGALENLRCYDGRSAPKTWLQRGARQEIVDWFRRNRFSRGVRLSRAARIEGPFARPAFQLDAPVRSNDGEGSSEVADPREVAAATHYFSQEEVTYALSALTDREAAIVKARFGIPLKQLEIARLIGQTESNVSRIIKESLTKMRARVEEGEQE